MRISPVSTEIGIASASKLCRSIVIKGMEALMVDLTLASERAGVMSAVLASLNASYPGMDWENLANGMPSRVVDTASAALRRCGKQAACSTEMGLDGALARAVADRHESYANSFFEPSR